MALSFAPSLLSSEDESPRQFAGVAYSGGVIPNYGQLGDVAIDLSTLAAPTKEVFALLNHDTNQRAGRAAITNTGSTIEILGSFLKNSASGRQVAAEFAEGAPWEFSVGLNAEVRFFEKPTSVTVNGRSLTIQALLQNASVREVSFVPAGADPHTQAIAFAQDILTTVESPMDVELDQVKTQLASVSTLNADLQVKLSAMQDDHAKVVAELNSRLVLESEQSKVWAEKAQALETELHTFKAQMRQQAIEALFSDLHREYTDDTAQVYLSLSDEAFTAVANDLRSLKAPQLASSLFQEVAVGSNAPSKNEHDFATQLFAQVAGSK